MSTENKKNIVFNGTKRETHTINNGLKKFAKRLKNKFGISTNKDEISRDRLADTSLLIFGGSREAFDKNENLELKLWLAEGGRALFLVNENDGKSLQSNVNDFFQEYGITVNCDAVLRSVYYKYFHPKEVFISDGILIPDIIKNKNSISLVGNKSAKVSKSGNNSTTRYGSASENNSTDVKFPIVYPYGSTLSIHKPAHPLLSSGAISYPMNRPICGMWESDTVSEIGGKRGRLVVIGSTEIFADDFIDKEDNMKLCDILISWLLDLAELNMVSERKDENLVSEFIPVPNIESLSQTIKPCLQELDEMPSDFTKLFDMNLFKYDVDNIPKVLQLYKTLNIPHQPLTLIQPTFVCPLPKMSPATFPPTMKELPAPALDLFDLDDNFAPTETRLNQLTNKCTNGESDLEYYISETGNIFNITNNLKHGEKSAKHILFAIFQACVQYKKSSFDPNAYDNSNTFTTFNQQFGNTAGTLESAFGKTDASVVSVGSVNSVYANAKKLPNVDGKLDDLTPMTFSEARPNKSKLQALGSIPATTITSMGSESKFTGGSNQSRRNQLSVESK